MVRVKDDIFCIRFAAEGHLALAAVETHDQAVLGAGGKKREAEVAADMVGELDQQAGVVNGLAVAVHVVAALGLDEFRLGVHQPMNDVEFMDAVLHQGATGPYR